MKSRRFNRSNCIRSPLVGRIGGSSRPHWRIGLAKVSQGYGTTLTACQPRKNACRDPGAPPAAPCQLAGRCNTLGKHSAPQIAASQERVPALFGGVVLLDLVNPFATNRTKPNMNPPTAVPYITEAGT